MAAEPPEAAAGRAWRVRGGRVGLERPVILGVLNVTPDSFSDGGRFLEAEDAVARAREMVRCGADLVDVGGESTRPGAGPVDAATEWRRVGPVVARLREEGISVSIDTRKAEVARRALEAGAAVVNDVSGLRHDPEMADVVAAHGAGLVVMHMRGTPRTMQGDTTYADLLGEVRAGLAASVERAREAGCAPEQVVVDPGIGFGKSARGSLGLIAELARLRTLGRPILVGPSRKSFLGAVLGLPVEERVEGTVAACLAAYERGAELFRVHDVRAVRRALRVAAAVRAAGAGPEDKGEGEGD